MKPLEYFMKPYLSVLSVLGKNPISISEIDSSPSANLRIYSVALSIFQTALAAYVLTNDVTNRFGFIGYAMRIIPVLGISLILASILVPTWNANQICNNFKRFNTVDKYLQEIGYYLNEKSACMFPLYVLVGYFLFYVVVIVFEFFYPVYVTDYPYYAEYFYWVCLEIGFIVTNINIYSWLLNQRFRFINKELEKMESDVKIGVKVVAKQYSADGFWKPFDKEDLLISNRIHPLIRRSYMRNCRSQEIVEKIKLLQKSHYQLCQICTNLGSLFTPAVVLTVLYTCIELLISLYTVFTIILHTKMIIWTYLGTCAKWAVVDIIRIFSIVLAFTSTEKQGNSTPALVHGILLETSDIEIQVELLKFSQQLIHHKLNFSTCGLFNLDMSLLVSITGALTTYLVILLQYSSAPAELTPNTTILQSTTVI